jgi:RNA polymerase sigma factor (sigma-70 family)
MSETREVNCVKTMDDSCETGRRSMAYNNEINKFDRLTDEETLRLVGIRDNPHVAADVKKAAFDKLVQHNLRLVRNLAVKEFINCGLQFDDIVQCGSLALMKVMEKFHPEKGKLSVYLRFWMKRFINRDVAKFHPSRVMSLGSSSCTKTSQLVTFSRDFELAHGRKPSIREIADGMDMGEKQAGSLLKLSEMRRVGMTVAEQHSAEPETDEPVDGTAIKYVRVAMTLLDARERDVIVSRFDLDGNNKQTLKQIGTRHQVTPEMIRQIQLSSMRKLRDIVTVMKQENMSYENPDVDKIKSILFPSQAKGRGANEPVGEDCELPEAPVC